MVDTTISSEKATHNEHGLSKDVDKSLTPKPAEQSKASAHPKSSAVDARSDMTKPPQPGPQDTVRLITSSSSSTPQILKAGSGNQHLPSFVYASFGSGQMPVPILLNSSASLTMMGRKMLDKISPKDAKNVTTLPAPINLHSVVGNSSISQVVHTTFYVLGVSKGKAAGKRREDVILKIKGYVYILDTLGEVLVVGMDIMAPEGIALDNKNHRAIFTQHENATVPYIHTLVDDSESH